MNIRSASLLTALLFLAAPLALVPAATAQYPIDCTSETEPFVDPACLQTPPPLPTGGAACTQPANLPSDPVFALMCAVATAAMGTPDPDSDFDHDGRPDVAVLTVPTPVTPAESDPTVYFSEYGACPAGTQPISDYGTLDFFGDLACIDAAGTTPIYVQLDFFYNDANPATPDEWYGLDGPGPADFAADVMVFNPQTGAMMRGGNAQRVSTIFQHSAEARFGPAAYDLAVYAPSASAPDGANCLACIQFGEAGPERVVFGSGSSEGIIDLAPQPGSDYPNQWNHGESALVVGAPAPRPIVPGITFADGNGILLDAIHVKVGDPRSSDLDDDGFTDIDEALCTSNPTNGDSTCADLDGDGLEFTPGGDNDIYVNADSDKDGILSADDNCPTTFNPGQENRDGDLQGDACDPDADGDNVADGAADSCDDANSEIGPFTDHDGDGCKDATEDLDDDNDNILDANDSCPTGITGPSTAANDLDGDGCKDTEDLDDDNDGRPDTQDNCPRNANANQADTTEVAAGGTADGVGDACDGDKDGDGVPATVPTGTPAGNDPTAGDCNDSDPDVGAPEFGLCQVDNSLGPVNGVLDDVSEAVETVNQTVADLVGGGAPSPGTVVPLILYPECASEETRTERCDNDPLDVRDSRDLDGDGIRNEPNGQIDVVEERVYYLGDDGIVDVVVLRPSPAFGPLPGTAVRVTVREPTEDPVLAIIEQNLGAGSRFLCVHTHDTTLVTLGEGATVEEACAAPTDFTSDANFIGATAGSTIASQLMSTPAQPLFRLTDEDGDGLPEAIVITVPDPSSCGPTGSGPGTRVKCAAYATPIVVPLGGLPDVSPEALCPADLVGVLPFCAPPDADGDGVPDESDDCPGTPEGTTVGDDGCPVPPDPCDDGNAANNEGCDPCEGDLAGGEGCEEPCATAPACPPGGDPTAGLPGMLLEQVCALPGAADVIPDCAGGCETGPVCTPPAPDAPLEQCRDDMPRTVGPFTVCRNGESGGATGEGGISVRFFDFWVADL